MIETDASFLHAKYYSAKLDEFNKIYRDADQLQALQKLFQEQGQIEHARRWALEYADTHTAVGDLCAKLAYLDRHLLDLVHKPAENIAYLEKVLAVVRASRATIGEQSSEAILLNMIGTNHAALGDYHRAAHYFNEAWKIAEKHQDVPNMTQSQLNLGSASMHLGRHIQAVPYLKKAFGLSTQANDRIRAADALNHLGEISFRQGYYRDAIAYLEKALELSAGQRERAYILGTLGNAYLAQGYSLATALRHYQESLGLFDELGDEYGMMRSQIMLGDTYRRMKKSQQAKESFDKGYILAKDRGDVQCLMDVAFNYALLWLDTGEKEQALEWAQQALKNARLLKREDAERQAQDLVARCKPRPALPFWKKS